jgi:glycosyltransferase involved in cell wall biosynthesis
LTRKKFRKTLLRKTVLIVSGSPILGGAERSLLLLATHLPEQGWTPVLACPDGGLATEAERRGVRVIRTRLRSQTTVGARSNGATGYAPLALARFAADTLAGSWRILRLVRRERPALVHSNSLPTHLPAVVAARVSRRPALLHLREIVRPGPGRRVLDLAGRGAAAMVAISRATGSAVAHPRVELVLNPVDPPPALRPQPAWDLPRPVVGFLGRLDPPKGIEDLLEAAEEVDAHIVVVGAPWAGDDAYVASLHRLAEERAPGRVHFAGSLPDPWTALAGMDVLAVPSRMEPFGRVAAEAQLAGVPVVAADAGGLPDAVTDDVDGLLFPVGDVAALAHELRRVLCEPGLRERLVAAGEISGQRFHPQRHAERIAAIYADLVPEVAT